MKMTSLALFLSLFSLKANAIDRDYYEFIDYPQTYKELLITIKKAEDGFYRMNGPYVPSAKTPVTLHKNHKHYRAGCKSLLKFFGLLNANENKVDQDVIYSYEQLAKQGLGLCSGSLSSKELSQRDLWLSATQIRKDLQFQRQSRKY